MLYRGMDDTLFTYPTDGDAICRQLRNSPVWRTDEEGEQYCDPREYQDAYFDILESQGE